MTVVRRHGPAERASHLLFTMHSGITSAVQRIVTSDAAALIAIQNENGVDEVHVDDTVLPPPVARALEGWIEEMIARDAGSCGGNGSACSGPKHTRRLLFFQELVLAVEMRVRDGWDQVDRLHEAFAQSITYSLSSLNLLLRPIGKPYTISQTQLLKEQCCTNHLPLLPRILCQTTLPTNLISILTSTPLRTQNLLTSTILLPTNHRPTTIRPIMTQPLFTLRRSLLQI